MYIISVFSCSDRIHLLAIDDGLGPMRGHCFALSLFCSMSCPGSVDTSLAGKKNTTFYSVGIGWEYGVELTGLFFIFFFNCEHLLRCFSLRRGGGRGRRSSTNEPMAS